MWADSTDTMIIPSPNKRAEDLVTGKHYWCSAWFGRERVLLTNLTATHAKVVRDINAPVRLTTVRISETSFYDKQPV